MVDSFSILLVNPACQDKRITDDDARVVPIGLYYIAALLIENGFHVSILNLADNQADPVNVFMQTIHELPSLVGFSVTNPSRMNAMACAKRLKKDYPDIPVVFGGPAATFLSRHLLEACPAIDFIVPGEGEFSFLSLARHLKNNNGTPFSKINGLIYKDDSRLIKTQSQPLIQDLDCLPHPSTYFSFAHLSMSRGCPGKCTFCGSPKFWPNDQIRFHSPEWMVKEILQLVKNGVHHFYLSDDTFTMDKDRVLAFCHKIIDLALPITWNAISRVDCIDADLLPAMRKAGCIQISFGVESGSPAIRKTLGKPVLQESIVQAFKLTLSHGILPRAYFIYGSPGETDQTIQDSINLMHQISPLSAVFYMLVVFPGTHLYNHAKNKGLLNDTIWYRPIEDLPWFELDNHLDFKRVKTFGDRLRTDFYAHVSRFALDIQLIDRTDLHVFHADFLSRLAMTFSHGEYADHPKVIDAQKTAMRLYERALNYAPDARAFLGLGMLLQKQRSFAKAVRTLTTGLTYFKDHKGLNICMGVCLMNMGDFSLALPYFEPFKSAADVQHYIHMCHQQMTPKKEQD